MTVGEMRAIPENRVPASAEISGMCRGGEVAGLTSGCGEGWVGT